jgi:toxin CcdB
VRSACERGLAVAETRAQQWLQDNREAMDAWNPISNAMACRSPHFAHYDGPPRCLSDARQRRAWRCRRCAGRLLDHLATRAVVPLLPVADAPPPINELNPVFDIAGAPYVLLAQAIASIPVRELQAGCRLPDCQHDQIIRALDVLLLGF